MKRRTRLQRLDHVQLVDKLATLRLRRSRLGKDATAERRHLKRAEQRILAELAARSDA
jgi:hypothetical protein